MPANQSPAAQMSVRAALTALVVSALVSFSSIVPLGPERVQWISLFWLAVYASVVIAQAAWFGWQWLCNRETANSQRSL